MENGGGVSVTVHHADCAEKIRTLADCSIDSVVTDPPYALISISKRFGKSGRTESTATKAQPYQRHARGFMGKQWDTGAVAFTAEFWVEVLRVLKPGAHLIAFGGTRTYHRLACAIEDAGFEIRDQIGWVYGSGFPKSHDVSKGIDRHNGDAREKVLKPNPPAYQRSVGNTRPWMLDHDHKVDSDTAASAASAAWEGWGTALKPAWEPIVLARKPLTGSVAANVLAHGTGALNIDACRVEGEVPAFEYFETGSKRGFDGGIKGGARTGAKREGRWPANVIHDGSEEVIAAFPESDGQLASVGPQHGPKSSVNTYGDYGPRKTFNPRGDSGSAARFFYSAKADAGDRLESKHPTVKPVDLMAYLVRLITPPGGTVLDPFAGSGTTGMACLREGFNAVLIEREAEYVADIHRRLAHVKGDDTPLFARKTSAEVEARTLFDVANI